MRRRKNSTGIGALSGIPLLVHAIPHEIYGHLERLRTTIDLGLFALWESLLSEEEHDQWSRWRAEQGELSPPIFQKLDRLILKQAETFGWRLMLSNLVQLRFRAWEIENNGPNLFEQLGLVLAKAVRVLQRRQLPSLDDPGLYDYKRAAVRELRAALHHFRVAARNAASVEQAIQAFRRIVSESHEFPLLQMNLESWLQFFRKTKALHLLELTRGKRISAAALFDEQRAQFTGYNQEALRQKTSKLQRSKGQGCAPQGSLAKL